MVLTISMDHIENDHLEQVYANIQLTTQIVSQIVQETTKIDIKTFVVGSKGWMRTEHVAAWVRSSKLRWAGHIMRFAG